MTLRSASFGTAYVTALRLTVSTQAFFTVKLSFVTRYDLELLKPRFPDLLDCGMFSVAIKQYVKLSLPLIMHHDIKTRAGVEVQLHVFLTSATD
jgi:hypothetical protein